VEVSVGVGGREVAVAVDVDVAIADGVAVAVGGTDVFVGPVVAGANVGVGKAVSIRVGVSAFVGAGVSVLVGPGTHATSTTRASTMRGSDHRIREMDLVTRSDLSCPAYGKRSPSRPHAQGRGNILGDHGPLAFLNKEAGPGLEVGGIGTGAPASRKAWTVVWAKRGLPVA
jgi:hypothetical protein